MLINRVYLAISDNLQTGKIENIEVFKNKEAAESYIRNRCTYIEEKEVRE